MSKLHRLEKAQKRTEEQQINQTRGQAPWIGLGVFALSFIIYILTLAPSVPGGDAGELITAAYRLGIAHPPGYPLYTLLGKLFTFLPVGSIAWRVNLLSAFCDAIAAALIAVTVLTFTGQRLVAILASLLFAFSPLIWRYAVTAEVFALNNLFVSLSVCLLLSHLRNPSLRKVYVLSFVFGLAMSNHHTFVFYLIPFSMWTFWQQKRELNPKVFIFSLFSFGLGLLPYLYLPIAANFVKDTNWGDPRTLSGFFTHIARREYGTFNLGVADLGSGGQPFERLFFYFKDLFFYQSLFAGGLLAVYGVYITLKKGSEWKRTFIVCTLVAFVFYGFVFHLLANTPFRDPFNLGIHARFWQQMNVLVFIWLGIGFAALTQILRLDSKFITPIVILLSCIQLGLNYKVQDQSKNRVLDDYAHALMDPLPQNSILILEGDLNINVVQYFRNCEGYRPDLKILVQSLLAFDWYNRALRKVQPEITLPGAFYFRGKTTDEITNAEDTYSMRALIRANISKFPIFIYDGFRQADAVHISQLFGTRLIGLPSQVLPLADLHKISAKERAELIRQNLKMLDLQKLESFADDTWEHTVKLNLQGALKQLDLSQN